MSLTRDQRDALRHAIDQQRRQNENIPADGINHGTETAYADHHCRCGDCRAAAADARKRRRHSGRPPKIHNLSGYSNGCRCEICREASQLYRRRLYSRKAAP